MSFITYYIDGHIGISDPNAVWTNDANAFDGNTATAATTAAAGSISSNYLYGQGSNAPTDGPNIRSVKARLFGSGGSSTFTNMSGVIYTASLGLTLGTATSGTSSAVAGYGPYITLNLTSGAWTWAIINQLEVKFFNPSADAGSQANKLELLVTTGGSLQTNALRPRIYGPGLAR